jgi:glycogen(starch) synthase
MSRGSASTAASRGVHRVLMTADGVGGVWQYATDLSAALASRGAEVLLAVMGPPLTADQQAEAATEGVQVVEAGYRLEWMDDPWEDVAAAGAWLLALEREFAPDVVHLNGYCHAALPWRSPAIVVGHSCVRSWWRAVHNEAPPKSWARYTREVARGLQAARLVVTPTAAMLAALRDEYGAPDAGCVIPNGRASVNDPAPDPAAKSEIVFAAGRLWDEAKNVQALCDVAAQLPWPVVVAGDAVPPVNHSHDVSGPVQRVGRLSTKAIASWYARAAIYALPARYEPFGLSVLEAAAAGCALVLGDIPSLRENWADAALFVPPGDRGALAAAITGLTGDAARRAELARRAVARGRQFTVARMAAAYTAAYNALTKNEPFSIGQLLAGVAQRC